MAVIGVMSGIAIGIRQARHFTLVSVKRDRLIDKASIEQFLLMGDPA
jgi:hypothetical protein